MPWVKKGFIYKPSEEAPWMKSHAQVPTALVLEDRIRIYITVRPEQTISLMTFVDVDIKDPTKILYVHKEPLLELGAPGMFDEFGTMPNSINRVGDEVWLYYNGWNRGHTIPLYNGIGLAISKDGGKTFTRAYDGPIMAASKEEPFSALGATVMHDDGNWRMWYSTTTSWEKKHGKFEQVYTMFYAYSEDGINWVRPHIPLMPIEDSGECTVRSAVVKDDDLYRMWFCYRGSSDYRGGKGSYRIGYATSEDAMHWQRDDSKAGIEPSESGWDANMIANPSIVDTQYGRYMFYDGDNFGVDGFGYAIWQEE